MPPEVKWVVSGPHPAAPSQQCSYFYQGPIMDRMSGEQIWDSLVTLTFPELTP